MELFNLQATITLDTKQFEDAVNDAEKTAQQKGKSIGDKFISAAKVVGAAVVSIAGAATGVISTMTKSSVDAFAEYEQLIGGVQKLYGNMGQSVEEFAKSQGKSVDEVKGQWQKLEKAQNLVLQNAENAYKTSGMSMNEYMTNATSFSASLIKSLGGDTQKAAEQTDVAMRAISDNVNTFGSDMESVTNAFKGFAKSNYTMLDNLNLGYSATTEGMQQLIDDANEYAKANGKAADLSIESFSDIVTAIELIQEKQNIAGTTAREAASTIEGSLTMTKAAWQNVLTALGTGDLEKLSTHVQALGDSAATYINNLIPVITNIFESLPDALEPIVDKIGEALPKILKKMIPAFTELVSSIGVMFAEMFPALLEIIVEQLPVIIEGGVQIISALIEGIGNSLPTLIPAAIEAILTIADGLIQNIDMLIDAAIALILGLAEGIINSLPILLEMAPVIIEHLVTALIGNMEMLLSAALQLILVLVEGIINSIPQLIPAAIQIVAGVVAGIIKAFPRIVTAAGSLAKVFFSTLAKVKWGDIGRNIIKGIASGVRHAKKMLIQAVKNVGSATLKAIQKLLGIASPSKVFRDEVGKYMAEGIGVGFVENMPYDEIEDAMSFNYSVPEFETSYSMSSVDETSNQGDQRLYNLMSNFFPVLLDAIEGQKEVIIDGRQVINYVDTELGKKAVQKGRGN